MASARFSGSHEGSLRQISSASRKHRSASVARRERRPCGGRQGRTSTGPLRFATGVQLPRSASARQENPGSPAPVRRIRAKRPRVGNPRQVRTRQRQRSDAAAVHNRCPARRAAPALSKAEDYCLVISDSGVRPTPFQAAYRSGFPACKCWALPTPLRPPYALRFRPCRRHRWCGFPDRSKK